MLDKLRVTSKELKSSIIYPKRSVTIEYMHGDADADTEEYIPCDNDNEFIVNTLVIHCIDKTGDEREREYSVHQRAFLLTCVEFGLPIWLNNGRKERFVVPGDKGYPTEEAVKDDNLYEDIECYIDESDFIKPDATCYDNSAKITGFSCTIETADATIYYGPPAGFLDRYEILSKILPTD